MDGDAEAALAGAARQIEATYTLPLQAHVTMEPMNNALPEKSECWGAADAPYDIPNFRLEYAPAKTRIPIGWWRSVEHSFTCFAVECFVDEMATATGVDPLEWRLRLLANAKAYKMPWAEKDNDFKAARLIGALKLAADRAGWNRPLPAGRARGLACLYGFQTYVAEIAEVSIAHSVPRVHRVTCAVDCGQVVHPDNAANQIQGALIFGLSAVLESGITIEKGQTQKNFDTFPLIRMPDAPIVDGHFVPSPESPTGCGEPGLPPLAPAVANALLKLTGTRIRKLPVLPCRPERFGGRRRYNRSCRFRTPTERSSNR